MRARKSMTPLPFAVPLLSLMGIFVSGYLTWVHTAGTGFLCAGIGDCEKVNTSSYAEVAGVPVALLGLGLYAAILGASLARRQAGQAWQARLHLAVFGMSLAGSLYSAYLTYLEVAVIRAICPWCVLSALLIASILGLTVWEAQRIAARGGDLR